MHRKNMHFWLKSSKIGKIELADWAKKYPTKIDSLNSRINSKLKHKSCKGHSEIYRTLDFTQIRGLQVKLWSKQ